ncbi:MAG: hypothetical protein IJH07_04010 [Ruminococcus sp.]|nr:hypothetical protein [Ruminococcus sp.]
MNIHPIPHCPADAVMPPTIVYAPIILIALPLLAGLIVAAVFIVRHHRKKNSVVGAAAKPRESTADQQNR